MDYLNEIPNKILKYFSILTILTLFTGNFYEYFYFDSFGINIYSFISTSEAFSLFLGTFYFTFLILTGIFFLCLVFFNILIISKRRKKAKSNIYLAKRLLKLQNLLFKFIIIDFCFLLFAIVSVYKTDNYISRMPRILIVNFSFLLGFLCFIGNILFLLVLFFRRRRVVLKGFTISACIFLGLMTTAMWGRMNANLLKSSKRRPSITFIFKDRQYTTNDSTKFIGATEKYIFIFLKKPDSRQTLVLNKNDLIKPIEITFENIR